MSHGHSHGGGSSHSHGSKSKPKKTSAEKSPETIKSDNDFNYTKVPQGTDVVSQPNGLPYTEIEGNNGNAMAGNQNPNDKHVSLKEYYEIVYEARLLSGFFPTHADFLRALIASQSTFEQ